MSLSDDIIDVINNNLPLTIHCDSCDRDIDISDIFSKREWDRLVADILQAVVAKLIG